MPQFPSAIETEHLFDADIELDATEDLRQTPAGRRLIVIIKGGTVEGPRLQGKLHPGGGDWAMSQSNGAIEIDVRATIETDDAALIYVSYRGVLDAPPDVMRRALSGEDVSLSEYYFRTTPRFETGFEQYAWLNKQVCVGVGRVGRGRVGYRVFGVK
jgi:hypothetical protein